MKVTCWAYLNDKMMTRPLTPSPLFPGQPSFKCSAGVLIGICDTETLESLGTASSSGVSALACLQPL